MKHSVFSLMVLSALLFASCGQGRKAHKVIESFMEKEMKLGDYDVVGWTAPQVTHFVSDSMMQVMHRDAARALGADAKPSYAAKTPALQFVRVKYALGKDTLTQTFYLDEQLTGVVGFKNY